MADTRIWGTLTKTQHEVLREFLNPFIDICPDADNKIDPADKKRIAKVKKILNAQSGLPG
jgi:hypothetical protein